MLEVNQAQRSGKKGYYGRTETDANSQKRSYSGALSDVVKFFPGDQVLDFHLC